MSSNSLGQITTPEQLTAQVTNLVGRASQLAPEVLVLRDAQGHRNELHVGEGYLSSLRKAGGNVVDTGVVILPEIHELGVPARTVIKKENGSGVLVVTAQAGETQPIEGTFDRQKVGKVIIELDPGKSISVAIDVFSALEKEIAKRKKIAADGLDQDIKSLLKA